MDTKPTRAWLVRTLTFATCVRPPPAARAGTARVLLLYACVRRIELNVRPPRLPPPATVKNILKHDGIRGMYRGLGPTILGYLPTWAIYFAVYDGIKRRFGERPLGEVDGVRHVYPAAQVKGYQPLAREHPWTLHILSAMAAGATSTICTNPLWVIKTRFMVRSYPSPLFALRSSSPFPRYSDVRARLQTVTHRRHNHERKADTDIH